MENHGLGTQHGKMCTEIQLEMSQISHNLFGPSAQIGQLSGMFLKKSLFTCPLSIILYIIMHFVHPSQPYRKYLNLAFRRKCSLVVYHTGFRLIESLVRNGDR